MAKDKKTVRKRVTFLCSIAPLQSAIQVTGDGNGLRLKVDVSESELANALPLLAMRGEILRVTIEVMQSEPKGDPVERILATMDK